MAINQLAEAAQKVVKKIAKEVGQEVDLTIKLTKGRHGMDAYFDRRFIENNADIKKLLSEGKKEEAAQLAVVEMRKQNIYKDAREAFAKKDLGDEYIFSDDKGVHLAKKRPNKKLAGLNRAFQRFRLWWNVNIARIFKKAGRSQAIDANDANKIFNTVDPKVTEFITDLNKLDLDKSLEKLNKLDLTATQLKKDGVDSSAIQIALKDNPSDETNKMLKGLGIKADDGNTMLLFKDGDAYKPLTYKKQELEIMRPGDNRLRKNETIEVDAKDLIALSEKQRTDLTKLVDVDAVVVKNTADDLTDLANNKFEFVPVKDKLTKKQADDLNTAMDELRAGLKDGDTITKEALATKSGIDKANIPETMTFNISKKLPTNKIDITVDNVQSKLTEAINKGSTSEFLSKELGLTAKKLSDDGDETVVNLVSIPKKANVDNAEVLEKAGYKALDNDEQYFLQVFTKNADETNELRIPYTPAFNGGVNRAENLIDVKNLSKENIDKALDALNKFPDNEIVTIENMPENIEIIPHLINRGYEITRQGGLDLQVIANVNEMIMDAVTQNGNPNINVELLKTFLTNPNDKSKLLPLRSFSNGNPIT